MWTHSVLQRKILHSVRRTGREAAQPATRGQAMVEFAFSFALFSMMFFGFLIGAIILFGFLTVNSGAREGAHLLITNPSATTTDIMNQVCSTSTGLAGGTAACESMASTPDPTTLLVQCPPAGTPPSDLIIWVEPYAEVDRHPGAPIAVTVCYHVPVPTFSLPSLNGGRLYIFGPVWVAGRSVMNIPD